MSLKIKTLRHEIKVFFMFKIYFPIYYESEYVMFHTRGCKLKFKLNKL